MSKGRKDIYNDLEPEENDKIEHKEDFKKIKKMRKLYNIIRQLVRFSSDQCDKNCRYCDYSFNYCDLFDKSRTESKRCISCVEIFGK